MLTKLIIGHGGGSFGERALLGWVDVLSYDDERPALLVLGHLGYATQSAAALLH